MGISIHGLIKVGSDSKVAWISFVLISSRALSVLQTVTTAGLAQVDREKIYQWINELSSPETRENALLELSKKRESVTDLAPMLWHSCGTIAALLQVPVDHTQLTINAEFKTE